MLANKQDLPNALKVEQIKEIFNQIAQVLLYLRRYYVYLFFIFMLEIGSQRFKSDAGICFAWV